MKGEQIRIGNRTEVVQILSTEGRSNVMVEKNAAFRSIEDYPPVLQAKHVKEILCVSEAKAYEVMNSKKCPTIRMGKRMVVMKDSFIKFLYSNEGNTLLD